MTAASRDAVVVCTYGPSGIGKTTDQGYSFPRAIFIAAPGALQSIKTVCGYMPATAAARTIQEATALIQKESKNYKAVVIDDFSHIAEQTFNTLEKKFSGFRLWGELRDEALAFRDAARYAGVDVILNCFARETEFITAQGVKSFRDFEDGDAVTVLTHTGQWKPAKVRAYGPRSMNRITLKRGSLRHVVKATPDHRWLLHDGTDTVELREGMQLLRAPDVFRQWSWDSATDEERVLWVRGFFVGASRTESNGRAHVVLRGDRLAFEQRFVEAGATVAYSPVHKGDTLVFGEEWWPQTMPVPGCAPALVRAFVAGYLDAAGQRRPAKRAQGAVRLTWLFTSSPENAQFIRAMFPVAGVYLAHEIRTPKWSRFGSAELTWFSLLEEQAQAASADFYVESIVPAEPEPAWCLVVEDDHSFVLPFGLPTGNCWEQGPKTSPTAGYVRGGPMLSGKLPESIPALCDIVLRASHDKQRVPWPGVYRCSNDPAYVMKDRYNVAAQADPAPMNLAEILRAAGLDVERHPDMVQYEPVVEDFSRQLDAGEEVLTKANELYALLVKEGVAVPAARWILRDALDRYTLRKALSQSQSTFVNLSGKLL